MLNIGDSVLPKSPGGLWLSNVPITGCDQYHERVVVLRGIGKVMATKPYEVVYDGNDGFETEYRGTHHAYLISYNNCFGWAGEGALVPANKKTEC